MSAAPFDPIAYVAMTTWIGAVLFSLPAPLADSQIRALYVNIVLLACFTAQPLLSIIVIRAVSP